MRKHILCVLVVSMLTSAAIMSGCGTTGIPEANIAGSETTADAEKQDASDEQKEVKVTEDDEISKLTLEDLKEANSSEKIYSNHRNWLSENTVSEDNSGIAVKAYGVFDFKSYHEDGVAYFESDFLDEDGVSHKKEHSLFNGETDYYINVDPSDEKKMGIGWYCMSEDEKNEILMNKYAHPDSFIPFNYPEEEKLDSIKDNNDGTLTVITYIPTESCPEVINLPEEWKGGKVKYTYTFDKDTLEKKEIVTEIIADGKTYEFLTEKVFYDVDTPEGFDEISELVYSFKNDDPKNPKTLTVIYDPDTDDEETYRITVDKDFGIYTNIREGYSLYKDPKGNVPFTGSDRNSDITMFAIKD